MDTALRAMSDAVLTIAAERRVDAVLQKLADAARSLVAARYAAIGIPDREGGFATFIPSGMSELHDSVTQTLFSIGLTAEAAAELVDADPARARSQLGHLQELTRTAMLEMRSLIFELRPAELETEGLAAALRKHVDVLRRLHAQEIELSVAGERRLPAAVEKGLLRIAQEALGNALRHSGAERAELALHVRDSPAQL